MEIGGTSLFRFTDFGQQTKYKASGNIQSLLNYVDFVPAYCYQQMFYYCTI